MKEFKCIDDIPEFPRCDTPEQFNLAIEEYLEAGAIAKDDLIPGAYYLGQSRSTNVAQWTGYKFEFIRRKFSGKYIDSLEHFSEETPFDVFIPFKLITE